MYERKTRSLRDDSVGETPETFEIVSTKVTAGGGGYGMGCGKGRSGISS